MAYDTSKRTMVSKGAAGGVGVLAALLILTMTQLDIWYRIGLAAAAVVVIVGLGFMCARGGRADRPSTQAS